MKGKVYSYRVALILPLLLLWQASAFAQHTVTGQVRDAETSEPLPGVNIIIKGTAQGTAADINGEYSLRVFSPNDTLIVSFIGFQTQEVPVNGREVVDVELQSEASELDEVVVVAYGEQKKISVVGSQATIQPTELQSAPVGNLSTTLAGKLAGIVSVQRSGAPGMDNAEIWIRGISTFDQNLSHPLVLVDGVPRSYDEINPEDIASFSILKDAAATAVYGVRGANGVILINTKKGQAGKPKFKFRYNEGVTTLTKLPEFAGGVDFMLAANEALATRGQLPHFSEEAIEATRNQTDPDLYPDVDWFDTIFNDRGYTREANLHVSGGGQDAVYYVSASYFEDIGLFKTDELTQYNSQISDKRYNLTSNLTLNATKTTTLKLGVKGFLSQGNFPGTDGNVIYNDAYFSTPVSYPPVYSDGKFSNVTPGTILYNPYVELTQTGYRTNAANQINSNIEVVQELDFLIEGLSFRSLFAFDAYNFVSERREKRPDTYFATGRDSTGALIYEPPVEGQEFLGYNRLNNGNRSVYTQSSLTYNNSFGRHSFGGLLLYNQSDRSNTHTNDFVSSLPHRYRGVSGRVTYDFDERYFLEANFGYNGSENFVPENRYGFFPSVAGGWAISNERFFEPLKGVFQFLKFRFSHGLVGNSNIPGRRFAYLATVNRGVGGYTYGQNLNSYIQGTAVGEYASDVSWETSEKTNLGIDLWTLNNTLNLQADVFKEHRTDIFLRRQDFPHFAGIISNPFGNIGIVDNKGFDASLKYSGNFGDFNLQILGNVNFNRNEIIEDNLPQWKYPWLEREGRKVGQRFGYIALGLFESEEEIANSPEQTGDVRPGDIRFKDINGDGKIGPDDRYPIGFGSIPEWTYGFGVTMNYKGFSLSTFFQGVGNVDIYLSGEGFQPFQVGINRGNLFSNINDRWTTENPDPAAFYPRLAVGNVNDNYEASTWWLKNGRYLRLKNAQLSYRIPPNFAEKLYVRGARLFVAGVNLLTFSPFDLWDVELGNGKGANYPHVARYSAGIEIEF